MKEIRIRNLRGLIDTGDIRIKPLTVLVGKNSSGKSTLIRFFPLMKQSILTRKNEPILWYSKENVDFGSFKESISRKRNRDAMIFDFKFDIVDRKRSLLNNKIERKNYEVKLSVAFTEKKIKSVDITIQNASIKFNEVNDKYYELLVNGLSLGKEFIVRNPDTFSEFIPYFYFNNEKDKLGNSVSDVMENKIYDISKEKINTNSLSEQSDLRESIKQVLKTIILHKFIDFPEDNNFYESIRIMLKNSLQYSYLSSSESLDSHEEYTVNEKTENTFLHLYNDSEIEDKVMLNSYIIGSMSNRIIKECNEFLRFYFSNVHYIAPVRASAQRYYRAQGLSVDEIDPQGENIPMAINHLNSRDKLAFKKWTKDNFGFEIVTQSNGGHITLNISFNDDENLNLADTGFGFSQILPILLLLWRIENKKLSDRNFFPNVLNEHTVVIEQPELHLHPALQARLTDAFVNCVNKAKENELVLNIIIETHSETIINRIGQLVYKKNISKEKVNVLIFGDVDKQEKSNSVVKSVSYDDDGVIEEWPLGFFYPED